MLAKLFRAAFDGAPDSSLPPDAVLDERLEQAWQAARRAWSSVDVDRETFAAYLGARARPDLDLFQHASDLYLACAVVSEVHGAARAFEQAFGMEVDRGLRDLESAVEDPGQTARIALLVGDGQRPPRLASYAGLGPLRHWLRLTIVRMRVDLLRRRRRAPDPMQIEPETLAATIVAHGDPEQWTARADGIALLERAVVAALGKLAPDHRVLLRLNVSNGLSAKQLSVATGIHYATAKRRLARARAALWTEVRRHMVDEHRLTTKTIDSIAEAARSHVLARLPDLLGEAGDEQGP